MDMIAGHKFSLTFPEALRILDIEDFGERILTSNSHGELSHVAQYLYLAEAYKDLDPPSWFRPWFLGLVAFAEDHLERPATVFQYVLEILNEGLRRARK